MTSQHVRNDREFPDNNNHIGAQSTLVACGPLKLEVTVEPMLYFSEPFMTKSPWHSKVAKRKCLEENYVFMNPLK